LGSHSTKWQRFDLDGGRYVSAEIRFHQAYSDERIRTIWSRLRMLPDFSDARLERLVYQGRNIPL
jgi:hypothetical protein